MFLWLPLLGSPKCIAKNFSYDSVVCECNSTYCDSVGSATLPPVGQFCSYLSSRAGSRLEPTQGQVQANSSGTGERCWDVVGRCCSEQLHSIFYCLYIFFLFQASVWLLSPTRSTRRSGDSEELWQMQQPSTSCLFLPVLKTSCFGSTFLQKVHQKTQKSSRAMHWNSVI